MWDLSARNALNAGIRRRCLEKGARYAPGDTDPRVALAETIEKWMPKPQWWITLTFKRPETTTLTAIAALRSWLSRWVSAQRLNSERRSALSPLSHIAWCVEMQRRGAAHIHALGAGAERIYGPHCQRCFRALGWRPDWWTWWMLKESWAAHHGFARVFPFDPARAGGVFGYVAKYMYKDQGEHGLWEQGKDF